IQKSLTESDFLKDRSQASSAAGAFGQRSRTHQVKLSADGTASGRIWVPLSGERPGDEVPAGGLDVFFLRNGQAGRPGRTDSDGTFQVGGLEPGTYSLVAFGRTGLLAFSVNLTTSTEGGIEEFNSLAVPSQDIATAA